MLLGTLEVRQRSLSLVEDKKIIKRGEELCDGEEWILRVFGKDVGVKVVLFLAPFFRRD